jgi:hypothetical protein
MERDKSAVPLTALQNFKLMYSDFCMSIMLLKVVNTAVCQTINMVKGLLVKIVCQTMHAKMASLPGLGPLTRRLAALTRSESDPD